MSQFDLMATLYEVVSRPLAHRNSKEIIQNNWFLRNKFSFAVTSCETLNGALNHRDLNSELVCNEMKPEAFMEEYMSTVNKVKRCVNGIRTQNLRILEKRNRLANTVSQNDEALLRTEVGDIVSNQNAACRVVSQALKVMSAENKAFKSAHSAHARIRHNLHGSLFHQFRKTVDQYNDMQSLFHSEANARTVRQIKTALAGEEISDDIVRKINDGTIASASVVIQQILHGEKISGQVTDAIEGMSAKLTDVTALTKQIDQLGCMFEELKDIVDANAQKLENIEQNVHMAMDHVEAGNAELDKTQGRKQKLGKCTTWTAIIIASIIVVTILSILL